jgi:AAA+ ATPase superfamily predicted ATPase
MLDATERLHNELVELINDEQYFVIHAARQTGKTTLLINFANEINKEGKYYAVYCSLENAYTESEAKDGIKSIVYSLRSAFEIFSMPPFFTSTEISDIDHNYSNILKDFLTRYCAKLDKPLILLLDEADCLSENTLLSFLRQLRNGYVNRSIAPFPVSVALVGMRNIRDYKAKIRENQATLGTASPFNVITKSLTLRNFTKDEVITLYQQHTIETGQIFEEDAIELVFEQTQGQPWLVNAIAREIVMEQLKKDYSKAITTAMVAEAIKTIILRRDVHIDQLLDKLKEERVKKVIEQMIIGEGDDMERMSDDFNYVKDLGLIRLEGKTVVAGNPIFGRSVFNIRKQRRI